MGDDFPMFRAGLVLLAVIALAGGTYSLVSGEPVDWFRDGEESRGAGAAAGGKAEGGAPAQCRVVQRPLPLPQEIDESSGIAASGRTPGVFWTHNDSGEPLLFAVDAAGTLRGTVRLAGAELDDWEDMASGPCAAGHCLYVGDIGDNDGDRESITVYRVAEPSPDDEETQPAEALRGRYPDGPQDAEALLVTPAGEIYVLTKGENGPVTLYRYPAGAGGDGVATLERVRGVTEEKVKRESRITGGSVSPDGRWVAVRTLRALSLQPLEDFVAGRTGTMRHVDLSALGEPQGEAVAFDRDGGVVLTSEAGAKIGPSLISRLQCSL